jgi:hypothetical protein
VDAGRLKGLLLLVLRQLLDQTQLLLLLLQLEIWLSRQPLYRVDRELLLLLLLLLLLMLLLLLLLLLEL